MPKLVVEISEEEYNRIQNFDWDWKYADIWFAEEQKAIHNGKILPEGCGDLIDRKKLLSQFDSRYLEKRDIVQDNLAEGFMQCEKLIKEQNPVIKADEEGTNGSNNN